MIWNTFCGHCHVGLTSLLPLYHFSSLVLLSFHLLIVTRSQQTWLSRVNLTYSSVAFDAKPFYRSVVFRSIPDSLAEFNFKASERCLIHADNPYDSTEDRLGRSTPNTGVWVNPNVRLGCPSTLVPHTHTSLYSKIVGIWRNRLWRWCNSAVYTRWTAKRRFHNWGIKHPGLNEPGSYCLMNRA